MGTRWLRNRFVALLKCACDGCLAISVGSSRASPVPVLNMVLSRPFVDNRLRGDCTGRRPTQLAGRSRRRKGLLQDDDPRNGSLEQRRSSESEGLWSQNAPKDAPNAPKSYTPNLLNSNGGRDRTRTCDLLRVKYQNRFFSVLCFLLCPLIFNNLGRLLSLSRQPLKAQRDLF